MITLKEVRNRDRILKLPVTESTINFAFQKKMAIQNRKFCYIKNIIESWRSSSDDEREAFTYLMEALDEYLLTKFSNDELKNITRSLELDIVPSLKGDNYDSIYSFDAKYFTNLAGILESNKKCDRIIKNHERLNNICNMDNYIRTHYVPNDNTKIPELVYELCDMIDTIKMNNSIKINVALENIKYGLYKVGYINDKLILESIVNRFCQLENFDIEIISNIITRNELYSEDDKQAVGYLINESVDITYLEGTQIKSNSCANIINKLNLFKIGKFSKSALKGFVRSIYVRNETQIIEDLPNVFTWIRQLLVLSTLVVLPLGIVTIFIDCFIKMTLQRAEVTKAIKKVNSELNKVERKLDNASSDKTIERLEKYKTELEENLEKLEIYEDSLLSERERDSKYDFSESCILDNNFITYDGYKHSYHKDCAEKIAKVFNKIKSDSVYAEKVNFSKIQEFANNISKENIHKYLNAEGQIMIELASWNIGKQKFALLESVDDVRELDRRVLNSLYDFCQSIKEDSNVSISYEGDDEIVHIIATIENVYITDAEDKIDNITLEDATKALALIDIVQECHGYNIYDMIQEKMSLLNIDDITMLNSFCHESSLINENKVLEIYNNTKSCVLESENKDMKFIIESAILDFKNYDMDRQYNSVLEEYGAYLNMIEGLQEGKIRNTLKISGLKAKKAMQKAKDTDTKVSTALDNAVDRFYEKSQNALTNKNREAVIKGQIIPSFSALLKLAMGSALVGSINPALSIIAFVGGLAISKRATSKERQYILNEIEIQLKVIDKKIQLAESNNDMKSLEKLLKMQQQLRQEKQRIVYKGRIRNLRRERD